jgi:hypothetical protein
MINANLGHAFARHERVKKKMAFFVSKGKEFTENFLLSVSILRRFIYLVWDDEELAGALWASKELQKLT